MKLHREKSVLGSERGMAVILTLLVSAAISVVALSLILITETDTKIALATQLSKENLNTADGALQYAVDVLREKPMGGYLNYPWETVLPPTSRVRMDTTGDFILSNGTFQGGTLSSPDYGLTTDDDSTQTRVPLLDNNTPSAVIANIPIYSDTQTNAYYTVWIEAVQGPADWNSPGTPGTADGVFNQYDFDRYRIQIRARAVGLYGSIKDVVEILKVVDPDGSPLGDEPGATQGGVSGPVLTVPIKFP